jgi:hypothetical protein
MTTAANPEHHFATDMLAVLDEPVRRYFTHAISDGHDAHTPRSAATRAAIESVVFAPPSTVGWRRSSERA